ncbi:hypothetical protein BDR05DRAFT_964275 [Suillus weaverae]|nr:hypothetical protein BDR05DRAFT_964275 [Suillus weaverae]
MSMSPRIVAVFGATGTQGLSVIQALLADGTFVPRAITRNCSSEKAYDSQSPQYFTWIERDLGQCALALLKHYKDPESDVLSRTFYAVSAKVNYTQFASILQQALGKPVSFVSSQTTGMQEMDDMYDFQSEFGLYPHTAIPDPRLIKLGVKFHTMEEFSQEIKGRYV